MSVGVDLVGKPAPSGVFPIAVDKPEQPQLSREDLYKNAKWARQSRKQKLKNRKCNGELDNAVLRQTLEEASEALRWLEGPLSELEVSKRVGPLWTASKRFGVVQGDKTRVIDDLAEYFINLGFATDPAWSGPAHRIDETHEERHRK